MKLNSSSTVLWASPLVCSVNTTLYPEILNCFNETKSSIIFTSATFTSVLLILPVSIAILWMGVRRRRTTNSVTGPASHTDVFTEWIAAVEMSIIFGLLSFFCGICICDPRILTVGYYFLFFGNCAQPLFHFLICLERYLAIVHPVTYMGLKKSEGVRIRNISIGCILLMCFGIMCFAASVFPIFPVTFCFAFLAILAVIVCFLSLPVFCVLRRPGLGSDQSKQRASHIVMTITGLLLLRFFGNGASITIMNCLAESEMNHCEIFFSGTWLGLPSSLVVPLMFLHRRLTSSRGN